tara:strand:- start:471 stop:644 length:174 start_codon:yes stop_codon:yes gene_type:complete
MKILFLLILFLNIGCANKSLEHNLSKKDIFSEKMSFNEFKKKLDNYAINSPYPDLKD